MSLSLVVTSVGALVAVAWTGVLAARTSRRPAGYLIAWTVALFGLAVGLGAQTLGYLLGYDVMIFRAMELGGQVVAPLGVCLGIVEVTARRSGSRFAMRLVVSAITVIGLTVLGTDPISGGAAAFSKTFPDPVVYYQYLPQILISFILGPLAAITGLLAILAGLRRSRGSGRGSTALTPLVAGLAALLLAAPAVDLGLQQFAQITLAVPTTKLFGPAYLLAAVLIWLAANQAGSQQAAERRAGRAALADLDGPPGPARPPGPPGPAGSRDLAAEADGWTEDSVRSGAARLDDEEFGDFETGVGLDLAPVPGRQPESGQPGARIGQVEIVTLVPERAELFDRITDRLAEQIRTREPDTLAYVVHDVPGAPAIRVIYQVYRDQMAHQEHSRHPYLARYNEDRRPMVLSAKVVELDPRRAQASPLPPLPELLALCGIDLPDLIRASQRVLADRQAGYAGSPAVGYAEGQAAAGAVVPSPGPAPGPAADRYPAAGRGPVMPATVSRDQPLGAWQPGFQPATIRYSRPGPEQSADNEPGQPGRPGQAGQAGQAGQPGQPGQPDWPAAPGYPAGGPESAPRSAPAPAPGSDPDAAGYEQQYQGWAEIRGEERRSQ